MTDPFSIVVGTTSLIDVCFRFGRYLHDIKKGAGTVEEDIANLVGEVNSIETGTRSIQALWDKQHSKHQGSPSTDGNNFEQLWNDTGNALQRCRVTTEGLELVVKEIVGKEGAGVTGKRDALKKVLRIQSRDKELDLLRKQLMNCHSTLQILLTALNICYTRSAQDSTKSALTHVSSELESLGFTLQDFLATFRSTKTSIEGKKLETSITRAADVVSQISLNQHFLIPRAVSSIFTGLDTLLQQLSDDLDDTYLSRDEQLQKRFVIYGLGGSGKTEFCCKFAQDNRQRAKSQEIAKHTYAEIAKIGGAEPNYLAAKNWLASLDRPWLLIIDNADDPQFPLEDFFPGGERGLVLVTTRNPLNRVHGTVGSGSYHFEKLGQTEADALLLKAAGEPSPWTLSALNAAAHISKALGYLAIALVQAGKAIMKGMCTLANYLDYYDRSWQRIRHARSRSGSRGKWTDMVNMNVYSGYEIIFRGLEATDALATQDAVELLKMFSFFSHEGLRMDVLTSAVNHPKLQAAEDKKASIESSSNPPPVPRTWLQLAREWALWIGMVVQNDRSRPVLPDVLRDDDLQPFDKDRLRDGLDQLTQLSLVSHQQAIDSYSMHPLIHTWVRERPEMSTVEQAIWCQAGSTTLTQSILLPPLNSIESAESLRTHLLSHVSHIHKCQQILHSRFRENQKFRRWRLFLTQSDFGRREALEAAKFSFVYFENGFWSEAEQLQLKVREFVCGRLGTDHPASRRITLFLSATYAQQSRTNRAAELQEQVLRACERSLGPNNRETLKVMDTLGASRCFQGRYKQARELHEKALEGMMKTLGLKDPDTLEAIDNLGRVVWRSFQYQKACDLHARAVEGMTEVLGPFHDKTLLAKESLAVSYIDIGDGNLLRKAHDIMIEILEERKRKLGREQPFTLLAILNLARVKSAMGDHVEAENLIRAALPIAERNLGVNHLGVLAGTTYLARSLTQQKRYDEAEEMFNDVIGRHRYATAARDDGEHPDRILAMWYLVLCYQEHGKLHNAISICDQLEEAVSTIGGEQLGLQHPFWVKLQEKRKELETVLRDKRITALTPDHDCMEEEGPVTIAGDEAGGYETEAHKARRTQIQEHNLEVLPV